MENQPNGEMEEELFQELEAISMQIDIESQLAEIAEQSMIELKQPEILPIFDEYYGGIIFEEILEKGSRRPKIRDPKGGLTAAGRAYFKRKEGANLKPGVKGPANTPEKMRRKGSFLTRFFTNPSGPMKDDKGRPTRLALSAAAWGESVPQNMDDARELAAKGRRLLEKYNNVTKQKSQIAASVLNKSIFISHDVSAYGPDMKGLVSPSFISMAEGFEPESQEIYSRGMAIRNMSSLSPSHVKGDSWMMVDGEDMKRMQRAAAFMRSRRKKKKIIGIGGKTRRDLKK